MKHKEETSHGFVVLRSQEGQTLATGDQIQTAEGEHVIREIVLHFADGSIYDDASVFSQNADFGSLPITFGKWVRPFHL